MAFLGKNESGEFIRDPNEPKPTEGELFDAARLFKVWTMGQRPFGQPPPTGECPHEDRPCRIPGGRECLGKIVWWRRYMREVEPNIGRLIQ